MYVGKAEPTWKETHMRWYSSGRLRALSEYIRLGCKWLVGMNTLAYIIAVLLITVVKKFYSVVDKVFMAVIY